MTRTAHEAGAIGRCALFVLAARSRRAPMCLQSGGRSDDGEINAAIERPSQSRTFVLRCAVLVRIAVATFFSRSDLRE